jgi:hypothetical protein
MNIVTVIPNSFGYPTNSVGTDAVRRDNVLREAIPSVTQGERSAAERGLASDGDRNSQAANQANLFQNPTYERPTVNQALANNVNGEANKDNANQESAGKESAESKQEQQQDEDKKVDDKELGVLKERDREVRMREQGHAAVGGQHAGAPSYEYGSGSDGRPYAVGGEVSINVWTTKPLLTDISMAGTYAGGRVLEADVELNEQAQRTAAVVSGFYAGISEQSQSRLNFKV